MRYIFKINGQRSTGTYPSREAATTAAFLCAGDVKAAVIVSPA